MELKARLQRMLQIVEDAERVGVLADIERDIILAELREAYAELKFGEVEPAVVKEEPAAAKEEPAAAELPIIPVAPVEEESAEENEESDDEPEVEVELVFAEEDDEEEIEDRREEIEESSEKAEETLSTLDSRLSTNESAIEEFPINSTPKRSALLSLYDDGPIPVLGEQFSEAPSVADTIACLKGVAESTPIISLRDAIGVADKYMIIRELFDGDADEYEDAIYNLDTQKSFDDCIIYIAEHYAWSPNLQATKFVMELLNRKYN